MKKAFVAAVVAFAFSIPVLASATEDDKIDGKIDFAGLRSAIGKYKAAAGDNKSPSVERLHVTFKELRQECSEAHADLKAFESRAKRTKQKGHEDKHNAARHRVEPLLKDCAALEKSFPNELKETAKLEDENKKGTAVAKAGPPTEHGPGHARGAPATKPVPGHDRGAPPTKPVPGARPSAEH